MAIGPPSKIKHKQMAQNRIQSLAPMLFRCMRQPKCWIQLLDTFGDAWLFGVDPDFGSPKIGSDPFGRSQVITLVYGLLAGCLAFPHGFRWVSCCVQRLRCCERAQWRPRCCYNTRRPPEAPWRHSAARQTPFTGCNQCWRSCILDPWGKGSWPSVGLLVWQNRKLFHVTASCD